MAFVCPSNGDHVRWHRGRSRRGGGVESSHSVLRLYSALRASFSLPGLPVLVFLKGGLGRQDAVEGWSRPAIIFGGVRPHTLNLRERATGNGTEERLAATQLSA